MLYVELMFLGRGPCAETIQERQLEVIGKDNPMDVWAEKAAKDTKPRLPQSRLPC